MRLIVMQVSEVDRGCGHRRRLPLFRSHARPVQGICRLACTGRRLYFDKGPKLRAFASYQGSVLLSTTCSWESYGRLLQLRHAPQLTPCPVSQFPSQVLSDCVLGDLIHEHDSTS